MVKLVDLTEGAHVERDLMLIKVRANGDARDEVKRTTDIFRGQIVDVGPNVYTIQLARYQRQAGFFRAPAMGDDVEILRGGAFRVSARYFPRRERCCSL